MGGSSGALHRFFGLTIGVFVVLLASIMSGGLSAQEYIPRGQPIPESIRWTNVTPTGVGTRASASWAFGGVTSHHSFPVPVSSATLGNLAGAAVRRGLPIVGWGLVLRDIVNGAGWVIDELGQQVTTPSVPSDQLLPGSYVWSASIDSKALYSATPNGLSSYAQAYWARFDALPMSLVQIDSNTYAFRNKYGGDILVTRVLLPNAQPDAGTGSQPVPITAEQLGQAVKSSPQVVNAILIDPVTGAPIRTQELVDALNNLRHALEAANGITTPGADLSASEDFAQHQPSETAWPEFCGWALPVCDFIDWFKAEEPPSDRPEVPWEEEPPAPSSWTSGLGGGSCPSPVQFTVTLGAYSSSPEFSYDGICGFAGIMRPVLIAAATIVAALILAGIRSAKDA